MPDIICQTCRGVYCETTDLYDPAKPANASMIRLKQQFAHWQWRMAYGPHAHIRAAGLTCPRCKGPMVKIDERLILANMPAPADDGSTREAPVIETMVPAPVNAPFPEPEPVSPAPVYEPPAVIVTEPPVADELPMDIDSVVERCREYRAKNPHAKMFNVYVNVKHPWKFYQEFRQNVKDKI